ATWAGLPLGDAGAGLGAIAAELEQGDGLVDLPRREPAAKLPAPRLLGAFEPILLGWRSRDELLADHAARVMVGGMFRPFALARGRAAATWGINGGEVVIEPLARLGADDA